MGHPLKTNQNPRLYRYQRLVSFINKQYLSIGPAIFTFLRSGIAKTLGKDDLLAMPDFRRFWFSSVLDSFGGQIGGLALPLCAILLLQATPSQMGLLAACNALPFAIFGLPVGVWLDRNKKFPIMFSCELIFGLSLASIPLAYWLGVLSMPWMYVVNFVYGMGLVASGGAQQVFLTFLIGRDRLIDAQSRFVATDSVARLVGPGIAGLLVQWLTAPFAVLVNAIGLLVSAWNLRFIEAKETEPTPSGKHPLQDLKDGIAFVWGQPLLRTLAFTSGAWHILFYAYFALSLLFATRVLGMSPGVLGAAQMLGAVGVLLSSILLKPLVQRVGEGATILIGLSCAGLVFTLLPMLQPALFGSTMATTVAYAVLTFLFDCGAMLFMMPFGALRQSVTPDAMLGRMISTMRFLTVALAPLGAIAGGYIGDQYGVRAGLACVAGGTLATLAYLLLFTPLRRSRTS
jgi:MFS family permease